MAALVGKGGCFIFYHIFHKQFELFPLAGAAWATSWTGIFFGARGGIWIRSAKWVWDAASTSGLPWVRGGVLGLGILAGEAVWGREAVVAVGSDEAGEPLRGWGVSGDGRAW